MADTDGDYSGWNGTDRTIVSSLFIVVASVFLILVYMYVLCRARIQVTAAMIESDQQTESLESGGRQVPSREPFYTGLDPSILATLPVYVYKKTDQTDNNGKGECVVCLSPFENEEVAMFLPNCKHMFHSQCINMWFSSHTTCPICRCAAEPQVVPEQKKNTIGLLPFPAVELGFFHPITPSSEGTSDGLAEASKVGGLESGPANSFRRVGSGEWRQSERGFHPYDHTDRVLEDPERQ